MSNSNNWERTPGYNVMENVTVGILTIGECKTFLRGKEIALSLEEYELLSLLAWHAGKVLTTDFIEDKLFSTYFFSDEPTVDDTVRGIMEKLGNDSDMIWVYDLGDGRLGYKLRNDYVPE